MIPPARATISHRSGAAAPNGANSVVKITGSGFHVGPPVVISVAWTISLPQMIHAHGSYDGAACTASDTAASTTDTAATIV